MAQDVKPSTAHVADYNFTCILPSAHYERVRGKEYIDTLIAQPHGKMVIPCILDDDLHQDLSAELKAFYASKAEHVVNFTNHDGTRSIDEITMTAFIRVLAKMLGIAVDVPHSMKELERILLDEPPLSLEEESDNKSKLVVYMEKFMSSEEEKDKLDRTSTLVLCKALLEEKGYQELRSWVTKEPLPLEDDPYNLHRWGCSVELSDLIIHHDPLLAGLAMIVYIKSKLPNKRKVKTQKIVTLKDREDGSVEVQGSVEPLIEVIDVELGKEGELTEVEIVDSLAVENAEPETESPTLVYGSTLQDLVADNVATLKSISGEIVEAPVQPILSYNGLTGVQVEYLNGKQSKEVLPEVRKRTFTAVCTQQSKEKWNWVSTPNHKCSLLNKKKRVMLSVKAFMFMADLVTDLIFTVEMFRDGENSLGTLSLIFIILPLFVGNSLLKDQVSFQLTAKHAFLKNKWLLRALDVLQLKPMVYCLALLSHECGRMWVTAKNFYDYTRVRYLERMTENVPETILQLYVITIELFYLEKQNQNKWRVWSFSNFNRCFSLVLSLILFPKAIVDKEDWARKCNQEQFDFCLKKKVCFCDQNLSCCRGNIIRCRICKVFTRLKIPLQTPIIYLAYLLMIISRLVFFACFCMVLNAPETKIGKYNAFPIIISVIIVCLKFIYYWNFGMRRYSLGILYRLGKCLPYGCLKDVKEPEDSPWVNFKLCFVKTYTQVFVPNNGMVSTNLADLTQFLLIPHFFILIEMCAVGIYISFYLEDKLRGVYSDFIIEWISHIAAQNVVLYCIAIIIYCFYWRFLHPDIFKDKVKWKKLQQVEFDKIEREREERGLGMGYNYEAKTWGCGVMLDCDYKSKGKVFNANKEKRKKELKEMNCLQLMWFKGLDWCYDPYDYNEKYNQSDG